MMRRNQFIFWLTIAGLVPFAYASSYAVNGAPPAEGCSGGSAVETGVLSLAAFDSAPTVAAIDAAFIFEATTNGIDSEAALAAIQVTVTDELGTNVPGNVWVLKAEGSSDGEQTLTLSWQWHGDPRPDGEILTLHASATNSAWTADLDATLTVKGGAYPEVRAPIVVLNRFDEALRDVGLLEECASLTDCGPTLFGKDLATRTRMSVELTTEHPDVMVAWEYEFQQLSGKGRLVDPGRTLRAFRDDYVDALEFTDVVDEYCVRVQARDLRNGDSEAVDFCASPSRPLDTLSLDGIGQCDEPPPGQHERWCRVPIDDSFRTERQEAECQRLLGSGEGGSGGEAPSPPNASGSGGTGANAPSSAGAAGESPGDGGTNRGGTSSNNAGTGATPTPNTPPDAAAGSPNDDPGGKNGTQRIVTDGGCGCRTAGRRDGALGLTGLLVLGAGLAFRRRRTNAS